jgi:hypothetical protein
MRVQRGGNEPSIGDFREYFALRCGRVAGLAVLVDLLSLSLLFVLRRRDPESPDP